MHSLLVLVLILVPISLGVIGYCLIRAGSRADRLAAEIDAKLFVDPETLPHVNVKRKTETRTLLVPLEIEVSSSTRFPGIPAARFEDQLRMVCARGARAYLDGETLGPEPLVSVELLH